MRNRKLGFCVVVLISIGFIGIQAQSILNVKENSGSNTSFYTNDIRKLTFSGGDLDVGKIDGSSSLYAISGIRKLEFTGISTDIQIPQKRKQTSEAIKLYPNPVNDFLYIKDNPDEECQFIIEILDLQGKVLQKETISRMNGINVSDLPKGMYICRVYIRDEIENIKFLKK